MRYVVTIEYTRKNQAHIDTFRTEDGSVQKSVRWCDNVQATDERQAALIYEETVRSEDVVISIDKVSVKEYEDGFKRGED